MYRTRPTSLRALTLAAAVFYAIYIARQASRIDGRTYFVLFDDAMISMRYAMNLAHGHGLRWNIGEAPVEGYTNFLWALVMAVVHLLPIERSMTSLAVMIVGAGVLVANISAVSALADRVSGGSALARPLAVALSAFSAPLTFWTLVGMEVGVLALMINAAAVLAIDHAEGTRRPVALGALLAAMTLVRIDAVVAVACIIGCLAAFGDRTVRRRDAPLWALAVLATLALHTAGRLAYYGDPLPNTYYLKATGVALTTRVARGLQYLFWTTCIHSGPLTALVLWWLASARRAALRLPVALCAAIVALQVAYSVYVGGDAWEYLGFSNRYLTVAFGPLAALVGAAAAAVGEGRHGMRVAPALRLVLTMGALAWVARAVQLQRWPQLLGVAAGSGLQRAIVGAALATAAVMMAVGWTRGLRGRVEGAFAGASGARATATAWVVLLMFATDAWFHGVWVALNANGREVQEENARLGLLVERSTRPGARIADFGAGATPYFCDRTFLDLLGKCDRRIARLPPAGPFLPGHNKWDHQYSIGDLRPDVVNRVFNGPTQEPLIPWERWGYDALPNGIHVRRDSRLVDPVALSRPWRTAQRPGDPGADHAPPAVQQRP